MLSCNPIVVEEENKVSILHIFSNAKIVSEGFKFYANKARVLLEKSDFILLPTSKKKTIYLRTPTFLKTKCKIEDTHQLFVSFQNVNRGNLLCL